MIDKQAIANFLARQTDNFDWLKRERVSQLDAALTELEPKPDFGKLKLWAHQKVALLILLELQRFMLHLDMGAGKTLISLLLLSYRKQCGEKIKAIVFVPYITSVSTWLDEAQKHTPHLKCVPLLGTTDFNLRSLQQDADIFIICYQSAVAMVTDTKYNPKKKKKEWVLQSSKVKKYFAGFNMLVMDEIHKCKNQSSLTYRMCRAISSQAEWALGLTGTPFGKDLQDLWAQFYLIDFGETLGDTLGFYRSVFFKQKINFWGGFEHTFNKKRMPDLKRVIKHRSIRYSIDEFADMPPQKFVVRALPAPPDIENFRVSALEAIKKAPKSQNGYQLIESSYLQLRQLSSGFLTLKGSETKLQVAFASNPKLDLLMELIDSMPHGTKGVIFHHFVYTNQLISDHLKKEGIKHARIWGGAKDPIGQLRKFRDDPDCQLLVLNWKSGSSSLNLQFANFMFVFEQPDSPIDRKQGEARVWRPGQTKRVFVYDLIVKDTMDWRILKANQSGETLLKQLLNGEVQL